MTRTTVITGAGSGIGLATADLLRERGENVIGVDLKGADITADLSNPEGRAKAVADVLAASGGTIDAIIAAAGVAAPAPITVAVNFFGVTEFVDGLVDALKQSDSPRVAVVSSMASLQPNSPELVDAMLAGDEAKALELGAALAEQGPEMGYLNYPSSKRALSRWIRREGITERYAGNHIPVNAVAPGTVITNMTKDLLATDAGKAMVDASVPMPLNYHADAIVIAKALAWLVSEENTHMTGQTIYVDGGADSTLRGDDIWS